jgi:hypothetical protein
VDPAEIDRPAAKKAKRTQVLPPACVEPNGRRAVRHTFPATRPFWPAYRDCGFELLLSLLLPELPELELEPLELPEPLLLPAELPELLFCPWLP